MKYKAVVFDLDGTLIDSAADLGNAVNRVLAAHGFPPHKISRYQDFIGNGAEMMVKQALPEESCDELTLKRCLNEFLEDYHQNYDVDTVLYEGIPELLDYFTNRSIKLSVLTNKPENIAIELQDSVLSDWHFELVMGSRNGVPKKPDPKGALLLSKEIDTDPAEMVYFGDSGIDMKTAVSAGMVPVGVLWGFREKEELIENGAEYIIEKPIDIIGKINF